MAGTDLNSDDNGLISSINITPFVDVVLVLLVIFIVTAPMLIKDILEVRLPKTSTGDGQVTETLGIAINRNGNILLNGQLLDEDSFKTRAQDALKQNSESQAIISADVAVEYGKVAHVIDLLKQTGFRKYALQIEKQDEGKNKSPSQ